MPDDGYLEETEEALLEGDTRFAPGTARSALARPTFRRIFIGFFLSNIGTWMQQVALGVLAYELTESAVFVGRPRCSPSSARRSFVGPVAGVIADSVDRRKLLFVVCGVQMASAFALAAIVAADDPSEVAITVAVLLGGIAAATFMPTFSAILPQIVGRADLPGAISLQSAQMNISRVIGPMIGAVALPDLRLQRGVRRQRRQLPVPRRRAGAGAPAGHQARATPRRSGGSAGSRPGCGSPAATASSAGRWSPSPRSRRCACCGSGSSRCSPPRSSASTASRPPTRCCSPASASAPPSARSRWARCSATCRSRCSCASGLRRLRRRPRRLRHAAHPGPRVPRRHRCSGASYFGTVTALNTTMQARLANHERGRVMALWMMGFGGAVALANLVFAPLVDAVGMPPLMLAGAAIAVGLSRYADLRPPAEADAVRAVGGPRRLSYRSSRAAARRSRPATRLPFTSTASPSPSGAERGQGAVEARTVGSP